jgi:serine/threonine protein kinase
MTGRLAEGTIIDGKYRIEKLLGEGGMGIVYQAIEVELERHVAIKFLRGEFMSNPQAVERFRHELRVLAGFNHTNITTLFTSFTWQGMPAMVMELVEGETFRNMVFRRGPIPEETSVPLVIQALLGVAEAHQRGIWHRDLKPENLMLNTAGTVKVMDFGIAKMEQVPGFTRTSTTIGTPHYMSPEQIDPHRFGMSGVDARTDIYSMGIVLYEMLAGEVPFSGPSEFSVQRAHLEERPQPPTVHYPHIRPEVTAAVFKAIEKDPSRRFQNAREFSQALQAALAGAPVQIADPVLPPSLLAMQGSAQPQLPPALPQQRGETVPVLTANQGAIVVEQARQTTPNQLNSTAAQTGLEEPSVPGNVLDALLNRWFGHTGRPRVVGAVAALLILCLFGGGAVGLVAVLRPNKLPPSNTFAGGGGGGSASIPASFTTPTQTPGPDPIVTKPEPTTSGDGSVNIGLPPSTQTPNPAPHNTATTKAPPSLPPSLPPLQPTVAGRWAGSFSSCSDSSLVQAAMSLNESPGGTADAVAVNGTMKVFTGGAYVTCGVNGNYSRTNHRLVIASSCPASVPLFLSASRRSILSVSGESEMTGTVAPENCTTATFHKY